MTVKGTWLLLEALGIIGFIAIYHNGPDWLVPRVRPFTCVFCLAFLTAIVVYAVEPSREHFWLIGVCPLLAGIVSGHFPWLFRAPPEEPPASDQM